jgi:hypothetical protein
MRPPGLLKPEDFEKLTDEELFKLKRDEAPSGSNYWEWATIEQQRREKLKESPNTNSEKVADRPHPITIRFAVLMAILATVGVIITGTGLWRNFHNSSNSPPRDAAPQASPQDTASKDTPPQPRNPPLPIIPPNLSQFRNLAVEMGWGVNAG